MQRKSTLSAAVALCLGLLFAGSRAEAGEYQIKHPLCDGSVECTATTVWLYGDDNGEPFDRIEAHIDGTCSVTRKDGSTVIASTETLSLSNGSANSTEGISRQWRFPKGCSAWFHVRHPANWPGKDNVWTTTQSTNQANVIVDPFHFSGGGHIPM